MRIIFLAIVATILAGCATTSTTNMMQIRDNKYNTVRYVPKQADPEFVGTSASDKAKATPSWYKFGHP